MRLRVKTALVAGAVGIGVAGFAFVGMGAHANDTSASPASDSITSGTFALQPAALGSSCNVQGPFVDSASGSASITNESLTSVGMTVSNGDPGYNYSCDFNVFDTGSLQGKLYSVTYTPPRGAPNALLQGMQIELFALPANGATPVPLVNGGGSQIVSAQYAQTFASTHANEFLQPNAAEQTTNNQGNEGWWGIEVVDILPSSLTNSSEGESDTLSFSVNGMSV
ncbi:MAG: hypothetical protein ACRDZ6_10435 [Acidimicrobiales bacterium]